MTAVHKESEKVETKQPLSLMTQIFIHYVIGSIHTLLNMLLSQHSILLTLLAGLGSMDKCVGDETGHSSDPSLNISSVHKHEIVHTFCLTSHMFKPSALLQSGVR